MTLVNAGAADRLLSAHSEVAGWTEIHGIKVVGPELQMCRFDDGLVIPSAATTVLKPRGYHLLMLGLAAPLVADSQFAMILYFEKAGSLEVGFKVEPPGPIGKRALDHEHGVN